MPPRRRDHLEHYVNRAPWDPYHTEPLTAKQEAYYLASQWRIMWWKLRRHKLAMVSGAVLAFFYLSVLCVEVIAPYHQDTRHDAQIYTPPQQLRFFHNGEFIGPFVYGTRTEFDLQQRELVTTLDIDNPQQVRFFCSGDSYRFWGVIPMDVHLFCPAEGGTLFLLGTDQLGRDVLSRMIYAGRVSLTIGLVGVTISFSLGLLMGGLAGYYGGWVDNVINRIIEIFQSFPQLPLWMALSAALPPTWSPLLIYFGITIILGLVDWTGLARAVRSKLLSLREEDFATAAQLMGASPGRVIRRHLLPSFASHLIASATLSIPAMILGETALSYLGLGLSAPVVSLGVLLNDAQDINVVAIYPWLMAPVIPVIVIVLAFQFFGDGLRDAADPYK
ncbi:MAG: ABC transporter permease [Rhodospirillaceae bacterium]|nr:ABC transporter permease [Rhodospirillaceae bacterium]